MVIAAVIGGTRAIRDTYYESRMGPSQFTREIVLGILALIGAGVVVGWLYSHNVWPWIVGIVIVWVVIAYFIPDRYWRK
jgi:hypothetical protein